MRDFKIGVVIEDPISDNLSGDGANGECHRTWVAAKLVSQARETKKTSKTKTGPAWSCFVFKSLLNFYK